VSAALAVRRAGASGDGVLWIHGYTLDSGVWDELWSALAGRRHVGVDLPGHGASRPLRRGEDLASLADEVHELAVGSGVRHLVALSFGTTLAVELAIRHPRAFATVTLGAPALAGAPTDPAAARKYEELVRLYRARGPGPHMTALWTQPPPEIFAYARRDPARWARLAATIDAHRWSELSDGAMLALTMGASHTPAALTRVGARTLVVIGEHELPIHRRCADIIASYVPAAEVAIVPGAGHLCLLEAPERAAALIDAHLG
jgi:3-oxoadipate enol-lactonase